MSQHGALLITFICTVKQVRVLRPSNFNVCLLICIHMSICFICSGTNADEAIANCHKDNVETERSWYLQEWPNEVQCKRQGRQRQRQCHCQLNSVKELSLCYLQSCRSCVGSLVWLPLCKDIAVATCWSGASTKLCQTVIAFLWLTFNCCGSALVGLGDTDYSPPTHTLSCTLPLTIFICGCVCGRSSGAAMLSAVTHMYRYMSFYNFLNAAVL